MEHEVNEAVDTDLSNNASFSGISGEKILSHDDCSELQISSRDEIPRQEHTGGGPSNRALEIKMFMSNALKKCREQASSYSMAKSVHDNEARESLVLFAEIVADKDFDLLAMGEILEIKLSKRQIKNPHLTLMRAVDPERDPKVHSRLAIALNYALSQCNWEPASLREFFKHKSIKQCLKDRWKAKRDERGDAASKPRKITLEGISETLAGEVVLRLRIFNRHAVVVELLNGPF